MQHSKRMVLVPEGTVERFQQRQQVLTPPVTQQLKNLDSEMTDILTDKHLDDEEKARRYNQVLQRYLTFYDQRKGQPLSVKITTPTVTKTEQSTEVSNSEPSKETQQQQQQQQAEIVEAIPTAIEQEVIKSVPKIYKAGARQLLDKIKENSDMLRWNDKGELIYENKAIPGSHIADLINDALRQRKNFQPIGSSVFARGLAKLNVPRKD